MPSIPLVGVERFVLWQVIVTPTTTVSALSPDTLVSFTMSAFMQQRFPFFFTHTIWYLWTCCHVFLSVDLNYSRSPLCKKCTNENHDKTQNEQSD
jgi:hypothetical protein